MLVIKNVYKVIDTILENDLMPNIYKILNVSETNQYYEFKIQSIDKPSNGVLFYVKLERNPNDGKYKMISNDGLTDKDAIGTVMNIRLDTISDINKFKGELYFIL
jgi:hypothetical protein